MKTDDQQTTDGTVKNSELITLGEELDDLIIRIDPTSERTLAQLASKMLDGGKCSQREVLEMLEAAKQEIEESQTPENASMRKSLQIPLSTWIRYSPSQKNKAQKDGPDPDDQTGNDSTTPNTKPLACGDIAGRILDCLSVEGYITPSQRAVNKSLGIDDETFRRFNPGSQPRTVSLSVDDEAPGCDIDDVCRRLREAHRMEMDGLEALSVDDESPSFDFDDVCRNLREAHRMNRESLEALSVDSNQGREWRIVKPLEIVLR